MRLTVRHQTAYHYASPIAYAIQTVRLAPRSNDGQTVLRWAVLGEAGRALPSYVDGYGNLVHCHSVTRPHASAAILVEGEVETRDTFGVLRGAAEPLPPAFFLRETPLTAADAGVAELAQKVRGRGTLDRLHRLMNAVRDRIAYRLGATETTTTAAEALARGSGVCQDHAHLFIAAAKCLGIPARYVSGYLWTGEQEQNLEASHAWAEAYVTDLGWVGFDASSRICPTEAYIRTSVGLDYWAAAPVRGIRRGEASETLAVKVRVQQAASQQ
jgi:transglutaminase-like putative cysteine protease